MSSNVLSIIPTDPKWRPERAAAERIHRVLAQLLAPGAPDVLDWEIDITWHDTVTCIDCGSNLERILCPQCGGAIDTGWWADLVDEREGIGFDDLSATVPCCNRQASLDTLAYEWPCGFASFEVAIWDPDRDLFTDRELSFFAQALGHPVKQIMARI